MIMVQLKPLKCINVKCVKFKQYIIIFLVLIILLALHWNCFLLEDRFKTADAITINEPTLSNETAEVDSLVERVPRFPHQENMKSLKIAVFIFHTYHSTLAKIQLHLLRKLTVGLAAIEIFVDAPESIGMRNVASLYKVNLHIFPPSLHSESKSPTVRNTEVIDWALRNMAKQYLANRTAILLLDGDVMPLTTFNAEALLNSRDIVCRKDPDPLLRNCWMGFICLAPTILSTLHDFSVSPFKWRGRSYDAGGRTVEYLFKHQNVSFSWMKETILLETDRKLMWGVFDTDISWIKSHFKPCDKCGPEVFLSKNKHDYIAFYHMISATSDWRFPSQGERRQAMYESIMQSPYGANGELPILDLVASVRKMQSMDTIPFHGNLTCSNICKMKS